jgi:hypothetical protein
MPMSPANQAFWDARQFDLFPRINSASLNWVDIQLIGGCKIQVCSPVFVSYSGTKTYNAGGKYEIAPGEDFFVPVTAEETYLLAKRFDAFPLTRAVADQVHNQAVRVTKSSMDASKIDECYNIPMISEYLRTNYRPYHRSKSKIVSGAHKLWVLSARRTSTNHGFHVPKNSAFHTPGNLDPKYSVIQDIGAIHDEKHWDYSQLLQLMANLTDGSGNQLKDPATGNDLTLLQALKNKHLAIWDEPEPWIGFKSGQESRLSKS